MLDTAPGDYSPNKSSREKIGSMVIIIYIQGGMLSVHWTCNSFSAVWKQLVSLQTWASHALPVSLWYLRASRQLTMLQHKHCQFQNSFNFIIFFLALRVLQKEKVGESYVQNAPCLQCVSPWGLRFPARSHRREDGPCLASRWALGLCCFSAGLLGRFHFCDICGDVVYIWIHLVLRLAEDT
jgi:hypothetical protein